MKALTKALIAGVTVLTSVLQIPAIKAIVVGFVSTHPTFSIIAGAVGTVAALLHSPSEA